MIFNSSGVRVYIALGTTDMRKSINGLSLLVEEHFELDLFSESLFAFCIRKRDIVKILYCVNNVFCIWMKRLEEDIFRWPDSEEEVMEVNREALGWLLDSLDLDHAHQSLPYTCAS
ncbi:MAG: transposase [Desulforhopalus sp.]|jgi:transposase